MGRTESRPGKRDVSGDGSTGAESGGAAPEALDLPPVPGDVVVQALLACGCHAARWTESACVVMRRRARFDLPRRAVFEAEALAELVAQFGIPPLAFVIALQTVGALAPR
jgi:hypothetical protein